ncbi:hypothetical protein LEP1GSC071_0973 [Leptospira santarosai str. JET]|nr:hypothetical protein LEP1GSC071_0973 [Leptospira santarosai str. JET]
MKSQIQATRFSEELRFRTRTGLVFLFFFSLSVQFLFLLGMAQIPGCFV